MIEVTVTCDTGKTWTTRFNGDHKSAVRYFLGQVFTDEDVTTGAETKHRVVSVITNPAEPGKPDATAALLLFKAEANLAELRAEYRKGESEDMREKYLDEIRDEIDKAHAVVAFLKANI
jgi:hypothetical protein